MHEARRHGQQLLRRFPCIAPSSRDRAYRGTCSMAPHLFHAELARSRGGQGGRPRCLVDDGRTRPKLVRRCWWSCPCPPRHPPRGSSRAVDVEVVRHALAFSGAGAGSFAYTPRGAVIESRGETGHGGRVVRIFSDVGAGRVSACGRRDHLRPWPGVSPRTTLGETNNNCCE